MTLAPSGKYHSSQRYELVIFDVRIPSAAESLHRERAARQEAADIEALDEDHFILVVRSSGVQEFAA